LSITSFSFLVGNASTTNIIIISLKKLLKYINQNKTLILFRIHVLQFDLVDRKLVNQEIKFLGKEIAHFKILLISRIGAYGQLRFWAIHLPVKKVSSDCVVFDTAVVTIRVTHPYSGIFLTNERSK